MKTIETLNPSPFRHLISTIGELPTSFTESMSYYELLAWLCDFLEKKVLPTVNTNAEALKELQDYVVNYFDNLDVQEEINNKLDEMAESGQLEEIISAYLEIHSILTFDNVASMKAATNLVEGSFAETYGFYAKGDGGGAKYKIREIENIDTVDEMFIIALNDQNLVAELVYSNTISLAQLGAKEDGSVDANDELTAAIGKSNIKKILIPNTTKLSTEFNINRELVIDLMGGTIDASDLESGDYLFNITTRYNGKFTLKNGHIIGNAGANFLKNTVDGTTWGYSFDLVNLEVVHFDKIVDGKNIYNSMVSNCLFSSNNGYFVYTADVMTNQNTFRNCYFKSYDQDSTVYPDYKFVLTKAKNWLFEQCSFEQQKTSISVTNSSDITVKSCEFEQQNYVANNDEGVFVDGSNYLYGLTKTYENYSFREIEKQTVMFSNVHTSDETDSNIRHTIRHAATTSGNTSYGLTSGGSGWVPLYSIGPKGFNFYQPINSIQAKSSGAVASQTIDITNFNKGSSKDTYIANLYTVVKGSGQSTHRMWKTPIVHVNGYTTRVGEPELVYAADWSGQDSYTTTLTVTVSDNNVLITPSQSVELYSYIKAEYLGDFTW